MEKDFPRFLGKTFLALALTINPWIGENSLQANPQDEEAERIIASIIPRPHQEIVNQEKAYHANKLKQFSPETLAAAERGELKGIQSILKGIFKNSFSNIIISTDGDFQFRLVLPYLQKAARRGNKEVLEFFANYDPMENSPWPDFYTNMNPYFMRCISKEIDELLEDEKVQENQDVFDLLQVLRGHEAMSTDKNKKEGWDPDLLESWKNILSHDRINLPFYRDRLFGNIFWRGDKEAHPLVKIMLENYLEGKTNAPSEKILKWILPDPKSEEYQDSIHYTRNKDWETQRVKWNAEYSSNFSKDDIKSRLSLYDQYHRRRSLIKKLIQEAPEKGEEKNLYHKVCEKLYGEENTSQEELPRGKSFEAPKAKSLKAAPKKVTFSKEVRFKKGTGVPPRKSSVQRKGKASVAKG